MASIRTRNGSKGPTHQVIWWDKKAKVQRSETFKDKRLANKRLKVIEGLLAQDQAPEIPDKLTYGSFYEEWMERDVPNRLTPKVQRQYKGAHKTLVLPFWQHRPLTDINVDTVTEWVEWMATQTKSYHSKDQAWISMSSCLAYAKFRNKVTVHPLRDLKGRLLPKTMKPKPKKKNLLDPSQILLLSNTVSKRYKAMILLLGVHGLRPCEAIPLTIEDVNLTEGFLMVTKDAVNVDGAMLLQDRTKTRLHDEHRVDLFPFVVNALIEHMKEFCDLADPCTLLFPSRYKKEMIHTDTLRSIIVNPAGKDIGFPFLTTYDLRHSAEVNLVTITKDPKLATEMLAHTEMGMTMKHYDHVTPGRVASAAKAMEHAFFGSESDGE